MPLDLQLLWTTCHSTATWLHPPVAGQYGATGEDTPLCLAVWKQHPWDHGNGKHWIQSIWCACGHPEKEAAHNNCQCLPNWQTKQWVSHPSDCIEPTKYYVSPRVLNMEGIIRRHWLGPKLIGNKWAPIFAFSCVIYDRHTMTWWLMLKDSWSTNQRSVIVD